MSDLPESPVPEAVATPTSEANAAAPVSAEAPAQPTPRKADMSPAECADALKRLFPALFAGPAKPIKLRVHADIQERAPGVFTKGSLSAFFRRYTGSTGYLVALTKAPTRLDLDGQPAGEITDEHRQMAREELARRRQVTRDREQQANAQEQAQQAQARQERQSRASLLRDFERTTLTLPNFCALKGLTPEALNPLLELARKEAAEAPPPRAHDERRGAHQPGGDRRDGQARGRGDGRSDGRSDGRGDGRRDGQGAPRGEGRQDRGPRGEGRGPRPAGAERASDARGRGPQRDGQRGQRPEGHGQPQRAPQAMQAAAPADASVAPVAPAKAEGSDGP